MTIFVLLACYGATWFIQNSELLALPRNWLIRRSVWIFKLLSCSFCTGWHVGWMLYLLCSYPTYSVSGFVLWSFASASFNYMTNIILDMFIEI